MTILNKDPNTKVVSLDNLFNEIKCLSPSIQNDYLRTLVSTESFIVLINGKEVSLNFASRTELRVESSLVAYRNGKDEYDYIQQEMDNAKSNYEKKKSDYWRKRIEYIQRFLDRLKPYKPYTPKKPHNCFKESVRQINYRSSWKDSNKYVVLDVETNGLSYKTHDLLSISIIDPSTGYAYNRFLPLENQPVVFTSHINGIYTDDLKDAFPLNQEEVDELIKFFDLKNKTILQYSGNKLFDKQFIDQYFRNHNLKGSEFFKWENIKAMVPSGLFAYQGSVTKDNLCNIFGIEGVTEIHTGLNDCLLEWKLYEKMSITRPIKIRGSYYEYNSDYVIPVSVLYENKNLFTYSGVPLRKFVGKVEKVYEYVIQGDELTDIRKYSTNITGISLENIIYKSLNVSTEDNSEFLINNRSKLKYIGSLTSLFHEIPISFDEEGLSVAINDEDKEFVDEVNKTTLAFKNKINPIITYIRDTIFKSKPIKGQEMVLSENGKVLALCDLSNEDSIVEIKTYDIDDNESGKIDSDYLKAQLFYQKARRDAFYLTIVFNYKESFGVNKLDSIACKVYKADVKECTPEEYEKDKNELTKPQRNVYTFIKDNNGCTLKDVMEHYSSHEEATLYVIKKLVKKKYVKRPRRYRVDPLYVLR